MDQFTFTRFEPSGTVEGHPNIKFATSMIDYVFRVLGVEYLKRYDLAHVPPQEVREELSNPTDAGAGQEQRERELVEPAAGGPRGLQRLERIRVRKGLELERDGDAFPGL